MILKAEEVARQPLLASSCGRARGHLDGRRRGGRLLPPSLPQPRWHSAGGVQGPVWVVGGVTSRTGSAPNSCSGWRDAGIPGEGCSAPLRMGLEEGRAILRRWMWHSRGCIPLHKPGIIWRGIWGDLGNDPPPEPGGCPGLRQNRHRP